MVPNRTQLPKTGRLNKSRSKKDSTLRVSRVEPFRVVHETVAHNTRRAPCASIH